MMKFGITVYYDIIEDIRARKLVFLGIVLVDAKKLVSTIVF